MTHADESRDADRARVDPPTGTAADVDGRRSTDVGITDELGHIETLPLHERAAAYGELHARLGRALDEDA